MAKRFPDSRNEPALFLKYCCDLKKSLIQYVLESFQEEVLTIASRGSGERVVTDEVSISHAIEAMIYEEDPGRGEHTLDLYIADNPELNEAACEILLGWKDSITGIFRLEDLRFPFVESVNLVDGLPYRLVATQDTPEIRRQLREGWFVFSRVARLRDAWMLSGFQQVIEPGARRFAFGMAAELAQRAPELFFRNPAHVEKAREIDRKDHARFLEMFGCPWVVGSPEEIAARWRDFLSPRAAGSLKARADAMELLPDPLRRADTVGMVHDPREGFYLLQDFGVFLAALDEPARAGEPGTRRVLRGYLEEQGIAPAVFRLAAEERGDRLDAVMAALLDRPGFRWARDGEACLREHNPSFITRPIYPSNLPLDSDLVDGLQFLQEEEERRGHHSGHHGECDCCHEPDHFESKQTLPNRPSEGARKKAKTRRKQSRRSRRRNR